MNEIKGFFNENRFLSNFWSVWVVYEGAPYRSTEHAYQAAKTLDLKQRKEIQEASTAQIAKNLGKKVTLRSDWEEIKEDVMRDLLIQKFSQPKFMQLLLDTGDAYLEETNHWGDKYWGVCGNDGKNRLGIILMEIRSDIIAILEDRAQGV
jgi:ribA/ribD-fused uncharacterized protein